MDLRLLNSRKDDRDRSKSSTENVMALQRVRSLAQRNRLALDKLSRLGSPSPVRSNTPNTRSPAPSASSSRLLHPPRQTRSATDNSPQASQELGRSGSETERESSTQYTSTHSHSSHSSSSHSRAYSMSSPRHRSATLSSSNRSTTPPPAGAPHHSPYNRHRHLSAPGSPDKARDTAMSSAASSTSNSNSNSSSSPSAPRRHRRSMASMSQLQLTDFEEEEDGESDNLRTATGTRTHTRDRTLNERDLITQSALAAVASSRRSPVGARRRGALPKEFRADLVEQSPSPRPGSVGRRRTQDVYESKDSYDRDTTQESWKDQEPITPSRPSQNLVGRSSTLRETRRNGVPSPRWSDDFRTPSTLRDRNYTAMHSTEDLPAKKERRQSLRGGSAESALWSLVVEAY
ncbi:hypothetical protein BJ912DRAFT_595972 [Pholiota molesta]|nr:hypothetical protein BJ912DRAFT_595972 [Pholiota molesta]